MSQTQKLRDLKTELESLLEKQLKEKVGKQRAHFLEEQEDILQRLKTRILAVSSPDKLFQAIGDELKNMRTLLGESKHEQVTDAYLNETAKITMDLAETVTISQHEDRFKKLESDSASVRFYKVLKRMLKTVKTFHRGFMNFGRKFLNKPTKAYGSWNQTIPYKRLAEFHLCQVEVLIKRWIDEDYEAITTAINGIEQHLAETFSSTPAADEEIELSSLEDHLQNVLDILYERQNNLEEQLDRDFETIRTDLFYYLERAGTLERRKSYYSTTRVERKTSQLRAALDDHLEQWHDTNRQLLDRTMTVKEFLEFSRSLGSEGHDFLFDLKSFFSDMLTDPIHSLRHDIEGIKEKLRELKKLREKEQAGRLVKDSKELLRKSAVDLQSTLEERIQAASLSQKANLFAERVLMEANGISEQVIFIGNLELDKRPPEIDYRMLEWRLLVVRSLKEHVLNKIQPSQQHYEDFLVRLTGDFAEVIEVVEVNLHSSLEMFLNEETDTEGAGDPFDIATEAMERTLIKLGSIKETVDDKHQKLRNTVLEGNEAFSNKMLQLIHTGDAKELQLLDAKYKVKQKAYGWQTKAGARWARIQDSVAVFRRFLWKKTKSYVSAVRRFLGFEEEEAEQVRKTDVATYLSETDSKINELPYIYRRLFNFGMDIDRRFYVSMNENFAYLKNAFESWENNYPATFAVVGEKGSGKSTYLHYALDDFFSEREVKHIHLEEGISSEVDFIKFMENQLELDGVDSVENIVEAVRKAKRKKVLVLEGLQNFYLRTIKGYGAIESLLYVISETREHIFWIVSCSLYAWNFLDKAVSIGEYFSHIFRTDKLDAKQIETVIMKRHRSSGYELQFEPGDALSKNRAYRKLMDQEEEAREYLRNMYFEELTKLSEGNVSIAMIFWLRSIREFDDTHFYIKPLEVTSLELIQELKPEVLFTLAAVVLHDTLTPAELAEILKFNEQESKLLLGRLKNRGLLQQNEDGRRYFINQLMYRQIVRVLKERNIIHLV